MLAVGLQEARPPFFLQSSSALKLREGRRIHVFVVQKRSMECKTPFCRITKKNYNNNVFNYLVSRCALSSQKRVVLIAFCPVTKKKPNQKYSVNWTHVVLCDPWKKYRQQVLGLTLHLHLLLGSSSNKSRQESNSCWRTELCTAVNSALRKNANKRMFKDCAMRSLERYWSIVIALATIIALNSHHVLDQSELKLSSSHVTYELGMKFLRNWPQQLT